jgi:hypothetical protein
VIATALASSRGAAVNGELVFACAAYRRGRR